MEMLNTPGHVVLVGDSIFDNAKYSAPEPDVVTQLRPMLPAGWRATLCAVDGAVTDALPDQLTRLPPDASHIVISIGGNDALENTDLLGLRVSSSAEALRACRDRVVAFERRYVRAITAALAIGPPVAVCTIYNGALQPDIASIAALLLALFNDVILRTAVDRHLDVLELRSICTEPEDYANPIEPSGQGGHKIAEAIVRMLRAPTRTSEMPARVWGAAEHIPA